MHATAALTGNAPPSELFNLIQVYKDTPYDSDSVKQGDAGLPLRKGRVCCLGRSSPTYEHFTYTTRSSWNSKHLCTEKMNYSALIITGSGMLLHACLGMCAAVLSALLKKRWDKKILRRLSGRESLSTRDRFWGMFLRLPEGHLQGMRTLFMRLVCVENAQFQSKLCPGWGRKDGAERSYIWGSAACPDCDEFGAEGTA